MNPIKAVYCRAVQLVLRAALPILPYREPEIFRSCAELRAVFTKKNIQRVLIVTDEGIVRSGIAGQLEAALDECGVCYTVYSETRPNPTVANVEAALKLYHRDHSQALIAIGGGSSMDCAKAVGARIARPRTPLGKLKGTLRILHKLPTLIAIPTTAGVCVPEESDAAAAARFIQAIRDLNARMDIPAHLEGIQECDIPVMAAHADREANPLYPVPRLMTEVELGGFYRQIAAAKAAHHGKQAS